MMSILNCNQGSVYNIIKKEVPNGFLPFLNPNWKSILTKFEKHNFSIDNFMFDRTGSIDHFLNVDKTAAPIPFAGEFNHSFDELVEKRAKELLAHGRPINVCWSGGIDSTFVLFCLLHHANDKDQVKVYGTYNSIIESGNLFDYHIKDKVKFNIFPNREAEGNFNADEMFVTGSCGNQIFYNDTIYAPTRDGILKYRTSGDISSYILHNMETPYEECIEDSWLDFYSEVIRKSERPIKTLQDFRWFISFNFKWYTVAYEPLKRQPSYRFKNIHSFFNTEDFQKWSITTKDKATIVGDYTDERWQLRNLISEYTGDSTYSSTKKNKTSMLSRNQPEWLFTLSDFSQVEFD